MHLPGRLAETTLGDVLGALIRRQVTGLVRLRESTGHGPERVHGIHLARGEVVAIETEAHVPVLGEILMQRGLLDAVAQRRLRQRLVSAAGRPVGELLVEEGYVSRDVVFAALRMQLRAKLDALFRIQDAILSFHVACTTPLCPATPLSPREFLRGRPRARDRAARTTRSGFARARTAGPSARPVGPSSAGPTARPGAPSSRSAGQGARPPERPSSEGRRLEALSLLGLGDDATSADVTRAFRKLAVQIHPDRHVHASEAERRVMAARFAALSAAYHAVVG